MIPEADSGPGFLKWPAVPYGQREGALKAISKIELEGIFLVVNLLSDRDYDISKKWWPNAVFVVITGWLPTHGCNDVVLLQWHTRQPMYLEDCSGELVPIGSTVATIHTIDYSNYYSEIFAVQLSAVWPPHIIWHIPSWPRRGDLRLGRSSELSIWWHHLQGQWEKAIHSQLSDEWFWADERYRILRRVTDNIADRPTLIPFAPCWSRMHPVSKQKGCPVIYIFLLLYAAERGYTQTEKEALAFFWEARKYLFGLGFTTVA